MLNLAWDTLLRRIPINFHEGLVLATTSGAELVTQNIIQIDKKYVIIRGRPAGTTEAGKIMLIPFDQVVYLSFKQPLTNPQVKAIFGSSNVQFPVVTNEDLGNQEEMEAGEEVNSPEEANGQQPDQGETTPAAAENQAPKQPSKSMILAKLRARLQGDSEKK